MDSKDVQDQCYLGIFSLRQALNGATGCGKDLKVKAVAIKKASILCRDILQVRESALT